MSAENIPFTPKQNKEVLKLSCIGFAIIESAILNLNLQLL